MEIKSRTRDLQQADFKTLLINVSVCLFVCAWTSHNALSVWRNGQQVASERQILHCSVCFDLSPAQVVKENITHQMHK